MMKLVKTKSRGLRGANEEGEAQVFTWSLDQMRQDPAELRSMTLIMA